MSRPSIQVVAHEKIGWVVKDGAQQLGHYPNLDCAEVVGRTIARQRKVELILHRGDNIERIDYSKRALQRWFARWIG